MSNLKLNDSVIRNQFKKDLIATFGFCCSACSIFLAAKENDSEKILHYEQNVMNTHARH